MCLSDTVTTGGRVCGGYVTMPLAHVAQRSAHIGARMTDYFPDAELALSAHKKIVLHTNAETDTVSVLVRLTPIVFRQHIATTALGSAL